VSEETEGQDTGAEAVAGGADPAAVALALSGASRDEADTFLRNQNAYVDGLRLASWQSSDLTGSLAIICPAFFVRSHMTAGQDGFPRREFLTLYRPLTAGAFFGVSRMLDRSITPPTRFLASSASARHGQLLCCLRGVESCNGFGRSVAFTADHEFPSDARVFVGQRHRSQFRRLALE
jgi:hypothetical protein